MNEEMVIDDILSRIKVVDNISDFGVTTVCLGIYFKRKTCLSNLKVPKTIVCIGIQNKSKFKMCSSMLEYLGYNIVKKEDNQRCKIKGKLDFEYNVKEYTFPIEIDHKFYPDWTTTDQSKYVNNHPDRLCIFASFNKDEARIGKKEKSLTEREILSYFRKGFEGTRWCLKDGVYNDGKSRSILYDNKYYATVNNKISQFQTYHSKSKKGEKGVREGTHFGVLTPRGEISMLLDYKNIKFIIEQAKRWDNIVNDYIKDTKSSERPYRILKKLTCVRK